MNKKSQQESLFDQLDTIEINHTNSEFYFYEKNKKREIVPVEDPTLNKIAQEKIKIILSTQFDLPSIFVENPEKVKLYNPKGNIEKASALLINPQDGAYSLKNKLNHMTGKEWTKFTCSWFIFNALPSDLKEEREITADSEEHPATYSPTMVSEFIKFFTKEGQNVFDPFSGIGSTLVAAKRTGRIGYGTELNEKYYNVIKKRVPEFQNNIFNIDCRKINELDLPKIHYSISSPPYWDVLQRSTDGFIKERENKNLDYKYSNSLEDLGNINDYEQFLEECCKVYFKLYDLLENGAYITIIVKNVKKGGRLYPLAWDMARILSQKYILKDEKLWIQDKIGLSPYGYPSSWASNILHHYCLILRKEE